MTLSFFLALQDDCACFVIARRGAASGNLAAKWDFTGACPERSARSSRRDGDGIRTGQSYTPYTDGQPGTVAITRYYFGGAYETTGSTWKKYYSFGGATLMRDADGFKYFLSDHLGSTSAVLDDEGTILEQQRYLPFGQARVMPPYASVTSTDFTYTGQRNIPDTGLMDYKARFYSPTLGRFIQPDSIIPGAANPQSWNRYSYVQNNPILLSDPTGHGPCSGFWNCVALVVDIISETAQYIQQNPINVSKSWTTSVPVVIPSGYGLEPGVFTKAIDIKVGVRIAGRTVGDDLAPPLLAIGLAATVLPNQVENINNKEPWNHYAGDLLVDAAGFGTSEIAGDIVAGGGALVGGPYGALAGNFIGDIGWGLAWDKMMDGDGKRQRFINWLGALPGEMKTINKFLFPEPNLPKPHKESPHPWEQIITPVRTPRPEQRKIEKLDMK